MTLGVLGVAVAIIYFSVKRMGGSCYTGSDAGIINCIESTTMEERLTGLTVSGERNGDAVLQALIRDYKVRCGGDPNQGSLTLDAIARFKHRALPFIDSLWNDASKVESAVILTRELCYREPKYFPRFVPRMERAAKSLKAGQERSLIEDFLREAQDKAL